MITVNKFANAERAMVYYRNIINDLYIFPENKKQYTQAMVISADNYPILYQDKDIEKYLRLFELEY
jgi:hypothetical protein